MPSIKEYRSRIRSLRSTNKITSAMKLVASSKLRRAMNEMSAFRPFAEAVQATAARVASSGADHPFFRAGKSGPMAFIVVGANGGLCGAFNNTLLRFAAHQVQGRTLVHAFGKKPQEFFHRSVKDAIVIDHPGILNRPKYDDSAQVGQDLIQEFLHGDICGVKLIYNRFVSTLSQVPTVIDLLPFPRQGNPDIAGVPGNGETESIANSHSDYEYEPDPEGVLGALLPGCVKATIYGAVLESAAGEHAARMTAMDNATRNSGKLIDELTIRMNRARQAAITTELTEIVAGAESLKD